jgi:hypothetical protein
LNAIKICRPPLIHQQKMAETGKDQDQQSRDQLGMKEVSPPFQECRGRPRFQHQSPDTLPGEQGQDNTKRQEVVKTGDEVTMKIDDGNGRYPEIGVTLVQVK